MMGAALLAHYQKNRHLSWLPFLRAGATALLRREPLMLPPPSLCRASSPAPSTGVIDVVPLSQHGTAGPTLPPAQHGTANFP